MSGRSAIVGEAVLPGARGRRAAVVVADGKISEVLLEPRSRDLPEESREVRGLICPGFVDLQINGAFGIDVGPNPEALQTLARELPKTGTTSFLPTLISSPIGRYGAFLEALERAALAPGRRYQGRTSRDRSSRPRARAPTTRRTCGRWTSGCWRNSSAPAWCAS